jgi:hypothetical protein
MMRRLLVFFCFLNGFLFAQPTLDLKEIMKGQDFTGYWPEAPQWNLDGSAVYFRWNKDGKGKSEPYKYTIKTGALDTISEVEMDDLVLFDQTQVVFPNQLSLIQNSLVLTDRKTNLRGKSKSECAGTKSNHASSFYRKRYTHSNRLLNLDRYS